MLTTQNKQYGFYGTIMDYNGTVEDAELFISPKKAWEITFEILSNCYSFSFPTEESVREYLDSEKGRILADNLVDEFNIFAALPIL